MGINIGNIEAKSIFVGSTEVQKVYAGATEIWSSAPDDPFAGIISYYRFDNNVLDAVGLNNLTFPANSYNTGITGEAALIPNGWSDTPQGTSNTFNFTNTDAFSYSFWYKNVSNPNDKGFIDKHGNQAGAGYSLYAYFDSLQFIIKGSNGGSIDMTSAFYTLPADTTTWHHIVWTNDGSQTAAGQLFYLDGVIFSMNININSLSSNTQSNNVFRLGVTKIRTLQGYMDETSVWDKVLTQEDVDFLYNNGNGNFLP